MTKCISKVRRSSCIPEQSCIIILLSSYPCNYVRVYTLAYSSYSVSSSTIVYVAYKHICSSMYKSLSCYVICFNQVLSIATCVNRTLYNFRLNTSVSSRNFLKGGQSKISWDCVGASMRLVRYIWKCQGGASRFQGGAKAPSRPPPKRNPEYSSSCIRTDG